MEAPLVENLLREVDACVDTDRRQVLLARLGIYYARSNRQDRARQIAADIRAQGRFPSSPEIYAWLCILEELAAFYGSGDLKQRIRLERAFTVAKAAGLEALAQLSAAWLAHRAFVASDFAKFGEWLAKTGLKDAILDDARIRASLAVADAIQCLGDFEAANGWYAISRHCASRIGDRASILATMENRAAFRLDREWLHQIMKPAPEWSFGELERELMGGVAIETHTHAETLFEQVSIWKARLEYLRGDYRRALEELRLAERDDVPGAASIIRGRSALLARIYAMQGDKGSAGNALGTAIASANLIDQPDDLAAACFNIYYALIALGRGLEAVEWEARGTAALERLRTEEFAILAALKSAGAYEPQHSAGEGAQVDEQ
jgi:hypothetical protein